MASIRQRGVKYQARVIRKGHSPVTRTFSNRTDAVKWARQVEVGIEQGALHTHTGRFTLTDLIQRYRDEVTPKKKNARTEQYLLAKWQEWDCAARLAHRVGTADVALWRDKKVGSGASAGTVRNALSALSAVYRHAALDWGMHRLENPVMRLRRPPPSKARSRRVTVAELRAIKSHTGSPVLPTLIDLAVETGMRLSEIVLLNWNDVNLRNRTAHLPDTKNGDSRTVPLSTAAAASLEALRTGCIQRIDGRVFGLTPHAVTVAFRRAVKRARDSHVKKLLDECRPDDGSFVNLRFHDLRHEAVSRLFELGLNVLEVSTISGHKTLQMLKRYTHLKASELVKKLG